MLGVATLTCSGCGLRIESAPGSKRKGGVVDGLRRINASKERDRREQEEEERENGFRDDDGDDEDML